MAKTKEQLLQQNTDTFRDEGSAAHTLKGPTRAAEARAFHSELIDCLFQAPALPEGVKWVQQPTIDISGSTVTVSAGSATWPGITEPVTYPETVYPNIALPTDPNIRIDRIEAKLDGSYEYMTGDEGTAATAPALSEGALFVGDTTWKSTGGEVGNPSDSIQIITDVHLDNLLEPGLYFGRYAAGIDAYGFPTQITSQQGHFFGYIEVLGKNAYAERAMVVHSPYGLISRTRAYTGPGTGAWSAWSSGGGGGGGNVNTVNDQTPDANKNVLLEGQHIKSTANLWSYIGLAASTSLITLKGWLDFLTNKVKANEEAINGKLDALERKATAATVNAGDLDWGIEPYQPLTGGVTISSITNPKLGVRFFDTTGGAVAFNLGGSARIFGEDMADKRRTIGLHCIQEDPAYFDIYLPGGGGAVTEPTHATDAILTALVAEMETDGIAPTTERQELMRTLMKTLYDAGIWQKLVDFRVQKTHDLPSAFINWVAPAQRKARLLGTIQPTFAVDGGITGAGASTAGVYGLNFTPSVDGGSLYTRDSSMIGVWIGSDVSAQTQYDIGVTDGTSEIRFVSRYNNDAQGNMHSGPGIATFSTAGQITSSAGLSIMQRVNGTAEASVELYKNGGLKLLIGSASIGLPTKEVYLLGRNNNGSIGSAQTSSRKLFASVAGAPLNNAEQQTLYNALNTYLSAF